MMDPPETKQCTNCKRHILCSNFVIHDIHCQRNIYLCTKCDEPVNYSLREEHDQANHALVFCNKCHVQVEKFTLNNHLSNDCPHRKVKCQICDIEVSVQDISEHENYCGARTEKCPECGEFVMLKYKQLHIESNHTFIKLSDEPGPSPSWQNGRRTLGNFLPDLSLAKSTPPSHYKKKSGRGETFRQRERCPPDLLGSNERAFNSPPDEEGMQKLHSLAKGRDLNSYSAEVRGAHSKTHSKKRTDFKNVDEKFGNVSYRPGTTTGPRETTMNGRDYTFDLRRPTSNYTDSMNVHQGQINDSAAAANCLDRDLSLAAALSNSLNDDAHLTNDKLIAQAIEESTAVLSEFSLLDSLEKNKAASKNIYSGIKSDKTVSKTRLANYDDSSDDEFLLYLKEDNAPDEVPLPCQFCGCMLPSHCLMAHQKQCGSYEDFSILGIDEFSKSSSKNCDKQLVECGICYRLIPLNRYTSHQNTAHSLQSKIKMKSTKGNKLE